MRAPSGGLLTRPLMERVPATRWGLRFATTPATRVEFIRFFMEFNEQFPPSPNGANDIGARWGYQFGLVYNNKGARPSYGGR